MDFNDENSLVGCVEQVLNHAGNIDIIVNNAGLGFYGALEDMPITDAKLIASCNQNSIRYTLIIETKKTAILRV